MIRLKKPFLEISINKNKDNGILVVSDSYYRRIKRKILVDRKRSIYYINIDCLNIDLNSSRNNKYKFIEYIEYLFPSEFYIIITILENLLLRIFTV